MDVLWCDTWEAKIHAGRRRGYAKALSYYTKEQVWAVIQRCQQQRPLDSANVRTSEVVFLAADGQYKEVGFEVVVTAYPRSPAEPAALETFTLALAERLLTGLQQNRVTVTFKDRMAVLQRGDAVSHPAA